MPTQAKTEAGRSTHHPSSPLPRGFYDRPTLKVAADLIGKVLVHQRGPVRTSGVIVEVEAYIGESDPACHAAPGPTPRNAPLYGPPGFAYVYLNYGIHYLMNVVTEGPGEPAAILIRALEPLEGLTVMRRRRRGAMTRRGSVPRDLQDAELCRGPGNLTVAMQLELDANRIDLLGDRVFVADFGIDHEQLDWTPRIGIRVGTDRRWRVHVKNHPAVSGRDRASDTDARRAGAHRV